MIRESRIFLTFFLLVLIPPVSAAPLPPIYIAILGVILFIVLVAIAARIADRYHLWESFNKPGELGYPEDDGRYEMKIFKGHGFGNDDEAPTPVIYEKRKHKKRGLTYQELANEAGAVESEQRIQTPIEQPAKPPKLSKKERREEKERKLREDLQLSISRDEKISGKKPFLSDDESAMPPREVTSPSHKRAKSPPPPPPKPRIDIPTSPSQKRPLSPPPREFEDPPPAQPPPRTKTPLSPKRRAKTPLSPQTPQRNPPNNAHNTLPAKSSEPAGSSEPVTSPTGYHYPTLPGGYYPPHPGGYPPVPTSPAYPVYPYPHPGMPAYPAYPPAPQSAAPENTTPPPVPVPVQAAAYHMPYPYPHPGYYPPHPGYPPTAPGVSQSKHQSQL